MHPTLNRTARRACRAPRLALLAALLAGTGATACGQSLDDAAPSLPKPVAEAASTAPRPADDRLFLALGGDSGIHALAAEFVRRIVADPRMHPFFEKTHLPTFEQHLAEQFCVVTGGPCDYTGAKMRRSHADFEIRASDFNAMVELLQAAMDAREVPFATQNQFLARLAPMHRDIVNTP